MFNIGHKTRMAGIYQGPKWARIYLSKYRITSVSLQSVFPSSSLSYSSFDHSLSPYPVARSL